MRSAAISAIGEQNLASAEEVSAVTEEQSAAMEQVRMLADNLRHIAVACGKPWKSLSWVDWGTTNSWKLEEEYW